MKKFNTLYDILEDDGFKEYLKELERKESEKPFEFFNNLISGIPDKPVRIIMQKGSSSLMRNVLNYLEHLQTEDIDNKINSLINNE